MPTGRADIDDDTWFELQFDPARAKAQCGITLPAFPNDIQDRFLAGDFQFYPVGHGELTEDCTGETLIPRSYIERHYRSYFAGLLEDVPNVDQNVLVLKKPAS